MKHFRNLKRIKSKNYAKVKKDLRSRFDIEESTNGEDALKEVVELKERAFSNGLSFQLTYRRLVSFNISLGDCPIRIARCLTDGKC